MYYGQHFRVKRLKHREYVTLPIARKSKRHNIHHVRNSWDGGVQWGQGKFQNGTRLMAISKSTDGCHLKEELDCISVASKTFCHEQWMEEIRFWILKTKHCFTELRTLQPSLHHRRAQVKLSNHQSKMRQRIQLFESQQSGFKPQLSLRKAT